ncbi:apolipoprotein N-acyltransferase [Streptomyces marispadix]|uniref:Apolipoprotein N-acyltransferase n=1 Tax=Streptomyces marispadix TaxID=2922868 RepID=A0ABS9SRR8_9ACTN|nr:apolipoprotein N-acyltransferase [Streptomyces marispadix]MCH6158979.1 apolipoprotein N-acyltransferase [Streptomyces marispadix]
MAAGHEEAPRARGLGRRARPALAAVAGAVPAFAFPAPSLWWLAWVALVPWLLLVRGAPTGRQAAVAGWLGGTGFILAVHHWLLPSLHVFLFVLAALLGLLWAPWAWLVRRLLGGRPGPGGVAAAVVLVPSGWLMAELVRSWEYLGGPWGLLGASQWQVTPALRLASVGGVWLVTFVLVAVNTALAALAAMLLVRRDGGAADAGSGPGTGMGMGAASGKDTGAGAHEAKSGRPAVSSALRSPLSPAVASCAALAVCGGAVAAAWAWAPVPRTDRELRVAVVQPGVVTGQRARLERSESLTRELTGRSMDLVVWGESSVSFDLNSHPRLREHLSALSSKVGSPILVNVDARRSDRPGIYKSSILLGPDGQVGRRYDKNRLVPFGEYIPARSLLGWATSVGRAAGEDRLRGDGPVMMRGSGVKFGPLVCFESAFPDMSRQLALDGARLIVTQSSTSTFQHSWAPAQHASLAALRAAETGRPMVHATLTGVSAVYGPHGERIGPWLGTDRHTAEVYKVPLATGSTLYLRTGDWIVHTAVAALVVYGAAEGAGAFRRRRRGGGRGGGGRGSSGSRDSGEGPEGAGSSKSSSPGGD